MRQVLLPGFEDLGAHPVSLREGVSPEDFQVDRLAGDSGFKTVVIAGAPGRQAYRYPTGCLVAGARKAGLFHEALDQINGVSVLPLPIGRQPRGDLP